MLDIFGIKFMIDDKDALEVLAGYKEIAFLQLRECVPQEASAFFDLLKRVPGMFMQHHIGTPKAIADHVSINKDRHYNSLRAIENYDCIAPYLTRKQQLQEYVEFCGESRVITEINYAYCSDLVVGDVALSYMSKFQRKRPQDWVKGLDRKLYPLNRPAALMPAKEEVQNSPTQVTLPSTATSTTQESSAQVTVMPNSLSHVGTQTKLDAVNVKIEADEPTEEIKIPIQTQLLIQLQASDKPPTGLSRVLDDPFESRAMFGAQRTGKTYFAAVASAEIAKKKNANIYHINLVSYGSEDSEYWNHVKRSVVCDIGMLDSYEVSHYVESAIELVKLFYRDPSPAILVVDEIVNIGSISNTHKDILAPLLNIIADKITTLASSGKKREKAIWTIAPSFVAMSLTQDAKTIKTLSLCYLSIHPKKVIDWNGQAIKFSQELFSQIANNYSILSPYNLPDCDRVAYLNNQWMPIGDLKLAESKVEMKVKADSNKTDTNSNLRVFTNELTAALLIAQNQGKPIQNMTAQKMIVNPVIGKRISELGLNESEVEESLKSVLSRLVEIKA